MKKKIVFITHDPGGLDVAFPVYKKIKSELTSKYDVALFALGPSGVIITDYKTSKEEFSGNLSQMIKDNEIILLITGTSWGDKSEIEAIKACNSNGIYTISIFDYWSNYIERFSDGEKIWFPNDVILMDQYAKEQAINAGIPQDRIKVLGHPGLDKIIFYKKKREKHYSNKRILFISQPISKLYGNKLGYTEQRCLNDIIKLSKDMYQLELEIFIKFHPKDEVEFMEEFSNYSVEGTITEICFEYDLIIGMNSMALLHTSILNIPTISYQPNIQIKNDLCISNKLGLTSVFTAYIELKSAVLEILTSEISSFNVINWLDKSKLIWVDGKSTERIFSYIKEVLKNEN